MAKGYIVADIHVRDKDGFEKFRDLKSLEKCVMLHPL